jgi:hypothetical protein
MESCLPLLPSDDFAYSEPGINRKKLEHNLKQLFVVNIPPELHEIYQEIGWIRNGHLKFHTIICGIWYFITFEIINKIKEDYPEDRYPVRNARLKYWEDLYSIYKTFLGNNDFYIIEKNIERIFVP